MEGSVDSRVIGQEGQWYDPEFLEGLKGRARRVAIADAESKEVDLVLRK